MWCKKFPFKEVKETKWTLVEEEAAEMPSGRIGNMSGPHSGLNAAKKEKEFPSLGTTLVHLI